jgi:hypothetical protein
MQPHADGRIWGWRAVIPQARVKTFPSKFIVRASVHFE